MTPLTWGELRAQVREGLLRDATPDEETGEYRWSDESLRLFCWWGLGAFASHTAVATATSYPADGLQYNLPPNLYSGEKLDTTGLVYIEKSNGRIVYLDPIRYTPGIRRDVGEGFYTYPDTVLKLSLQTPPTAGDTIVVNYFAHYNNPYADSDTIDIPAWGLAALSYLIAAHALSGVGLKSANIRQWLAKPDAGTPEQNPLRVQQQWFIQLYNDEMAKQPPQDRTNWFREISAE